MNGQFRPAFLPTLTAFRPLGLLRAALHPDAAWKRLYAALAASCLLHAAIVVLPYFGASPAASPAAARGAQKPGSGRALDVRLVEDIGQAAVAPAQPAGGEAPPPAPEHSLGMDLLPIPAPAYYAAEQLTKRPRATGAPDFGAPESGPDFGTGKVVLQLRISELGRVDSVHVEASDVPEAVSGRAAAAFGKLRFLPGEINGRAVGSVLKIEVTFEEGERDDSARNVGTLPPP